MKAIITTGDLAITNDGTHRRPRRYGRLTFAAALFSAAMMIQSAPATAQSQCSRTYTVDADFDEGLLQNVNHDAPNNNQLQLNARTTPPPFIWVANSGRGTVVRIDVNTGFIIGEYRTAPLERPTSPSRTTVDLFGNVWVGNRDEAGLINGVANGSVAKIGLVIGGTRTNSAGVPDVNGEYLKPPFTYSTAVDRDGDGLIRTSRGLFNILPWSDPTDPTVGDVADAVDECIIIYKRVPGADVVRHVSIDANNDVWIGGYPFALRDFLKLDGDNGSVLATIPASRGCGGYGGVVDGNGVIWSASWAEGRLMRHDPATSSSTCIPVANSYGIAIDNNGYIWNAMWSSNSIVKVDPAGNIVAGYPKTWSGASNCRGVAVTSDNNIWVANSGAHTVSRLDNNGVLLATIAVGTEPTGVAVDANGKVWVTNLGSHNTMRIDPATNSVDLTVGLGAGASPYNYSDMTGNVAIGATSQQGTWTTVLNCGSAGTGWGKVSWNGLTPSGTDIEVEVRASNNPAGLSSMSFVSVTNGTSFCGAGVSGQYLEIRTTLSRDPGVTATPVLYDLTAELCDVSSPVPAVATLPTITAQCSASVPTPSATDNCGGLVYGTTSDPVFYGAQGTYIVHWTYTDATGNTSTQNQEVVIDDNTYPTMSVAGVSELWPPNHDYHTYSIEQMVTGGSDNCNTALSASDVRIISATSDELEDAGGGGDGSTTQDIVIAGDCRSVRVRSERMGSGNGRVYRIRLKLDDGNGNATTATYLVKVRKSASHAAVEDAAMYAVTSSCNSAKLAPEVVTTTAGGYSLMQNNPNPFHPSTSIDYTLGQEGHVLLTVYDVNSTLVATLVDGEQSAGSHTARFDAGSLGSGIYIYRLQVNGTTLTGRMVLLK